KPRISGLKGLEPLFADTDRILKSTADFLMQEIASSANLDLENKVLAEGIRLIRNLLTIGERVPPLCVDCWLASVHAPILSAVLTADPRLTRSASPIRLICAGQSGHKRRIVLSHCS